MRADLVVEPVDLAAQALELRVILRLECRRPLLLQLAHLRFDGRLVDARNSVVLVDVDAERLA